jgi:hypothetical protein
MVKNNARVTSHHKITRTREQEINGGEIILFLFATNIIPILQVVYTKKSLSFSYFILLLVLTIQFNNTVGIAKTTTMMLLRIIDSLFPFLFLILGITSVVVVVSGMDMDMDSMYTDMDNNMDNMYNMDSMDSMDSIDSMDSMDNMHMDSIDSMHMDVDSMCMYIESTKTKCGECLPVGGGEPFDDMYLVTRLWTIVDPNATSDMDIINEFNSGFAPIVTSMPGFIQYTAAQTGNTSTVFFKNLFDSQEHAHSAQEAAKDFVSTNDILMDGAIIPYHFTEDVVAYDNTNGVDCVNTSNRNKFLATRLYESLDVTWTKDTLGALVYNNSMSSTISAQSGFVNHIASVSVEDDGKFLFFSDVFDSEDGAINANIMGLNAASANQDANPIEILAVTMGQIAFDYICTTTSAAVAVAVATPTTATPDETTGSTYSSSSSSSGSHRAVLRVSSLPYHYALLSIAVTVAGYML